MAQSALRNLQRERMDARRARIGMEPFVPQASTKTAGQAMSDVLGGMALATAPIPIVGDVAGAVSDAAMYAAYPEQRTMLNAGMSLAGLLPFVPAASFIKAAKGSINVGSDVKNMGSIPASLENYEIVDGLQMLPINAFETTKAKDLFYAKNDMDRVRQLSEQIEANKRIDPLIVVQDAEGYYVLEGGHRLGALDAIGAENVPAIIVKDLDNPYISELAPSPLEGTLDMSQAARMQRANEGNYLPETYYHASTSDIDEFKPKYADGLTFLTPNPEFANKWLGKGGSMSKLQKAAADSPFYKQYKSEKQGIWDKYVAKYGDDPDKWPEAESAAMWKETRNLTKQYDATDQAVYPLRTNVQNTFDPRQHEDVIIDFLKSKGRDPMASTISRGKTDLDYYKSGNYLLFETPEMVQFLKNKGFDSMRLAEDGYNNGTFDTLAVFNPANIRSVNAAFDPTKRNSANIMAGIMGGAVGLSALRSMNQQEEK